jgi:FkbM family methyltransferase
MGLSLPFFSSNYSRPRIYGFEPDETVFDALDQNIKKYKIDNVTLCRTAALDSTGTIEFYTHKGMGVGLIIMMRINLQNLLKRSH